MTNGWEITLFTDGSAVAHNRVTGANVVLPGEAPPVTRVNDLPSDFWALDDSVMYRGKHPRKNLPYDKMNRELCLHAINGGFHVDYRKLARRMYELFDDYELDEALTLLRAGGLGYVGSFMLVMMDIGYPKSLIPTAET